MCNLPKRLRDCTLVGDTGHEIKFCEEPRQCVNREFSVTLSSDETGWGEFFSVAELALLYTWAGEALRKYHNYAA